MELIRIENLFKTYHLGEIDVPVLTGVSFTINRGELVALMGASGSGKTTLMNILGCLDRPSSGEYWLDGKQISNLTPDERALVRTDNLGFVFQSFNLLPRTTAMSNVLMPLDYSPHRPHHGEAKRRALELLERVGLGQRLDHEPSQMSGGQQQRVAIARSLVNQPALVLADEPTGNLDSHTSVEILQMFQRLNATGITVILVTHDAKVASYATRIIRIADGRIESDSVNDPASLASPHSLPAVSTNGHSSNGDSAKHNGEHEGEIASNGNGRVDAGHGIGGPLPSSTSHVGSMGGGPGPIGSESGAGTATLAPARTRIQTSPQTAPVALSAESSARDRSGTIYSSQ